MKNSQQTLRKRTSEKPYHHGDLRNALIEAGLEVLAKQGAEALNLREVARKAGVSHAAPYRHFADKQALIDAIAADGFRELEAQLRGATTQADATTADQFVALGQAYVRFALQHPDHFKVMFSMLRDPAKQPELYASSKACFLVLFEAVVAGQTERDLIAGDPLHLSQAIWSAMHGLAVLLTEGQIGSTAGQSRLKAADELARRHAEWMLAGIGQRAFS